MEVNEVLLNQGDGLLCAQTLTDCKNAVCFIECVLRKKKKETIKRGSGFYAVFTLHGRRYKVIITNNHVLSNETDGRNAVARFGYEGCDEGEIVTLLPDLFFYTSPELDYTVVGCNELEVAALSFQLKPIELKEEYGLKAGDHVFIFQHPRGRPKEFSYKDICRVEPPFVFYNADTETGSSGSPVLWKLQGIAVHHKGSENLQYNKGTLFSEILKHLRTGEYTKNIRMPMLACTDLQDIECNEGQERQSSSSRKRSGPDKALQKPEEGELDDLAQDVVSFWKRLGRKLGVPNAKIEEIHRDNINYVSIVDKANQMLLEWLDVSNCPNYAELQGALDKLQKRGLARKYCL